MAQDMMARGGPPAVAAGRVTVFGSLHHDIMVDGPSLPRLGETVAGYDWHTRSGGKGLNQAVAAARAGAAVSMVGAVGDDDFACGLLRHLDRMGVDRTHVRLCEGARTGISVAITEDGGDYGAVIVSGANLLLGAIDVKGASELWRGTAILLLQNEVPEAANILAAEAAKERGARVLLNAAPARRLPVELTASIDILVVNAVEARMLAGGPDITSLEDALAAAKDLSCQVAAVAVTAGALGLAFAGESEGTIPALPVDVVGTHGAGDMFIGSLATDLARGESLARALHQANRAAAAFVAGATPP
jgi:ribokinase